MRAAFAFIIVVHALIHLLGFAKAFGLAEAAQLHQRISRPVGVLWLLAALLFVAGAILLFVAPSWWWVAAAPALLVSQPVILKSWGDAKFGTLANLMVLVPLVVSLLSYSPSSFHSIYRQQVENGLRRGATTSAVTDADLAHLPAAVQAYLRYHGVVGRPRVHNFRARFRGDMRSTPDGRWMASTFEQHNFYEPPARLFLMESSLFGIPFEALHLYLGPAATFQVKAASLLTVVDAKGPEMNQSETVTLFDDMCLLAPSTLIDRNIRWEEVDSLTAKGTFTNAHNTISAVLKFNDKGELTNFVSDDRYQTADGKVYKNVRWSTPVRDYRDFDGWKLAARGEAAWRMPEGEFVYGRFELIEVKYNLHQ